MRQAHDVIVVGGGLVGASCAAALDAAGLTVALVEGRAPVLRPSTGGEDWDGRIYAISPGSRRFLERLGVWDRLDRARLQAVHAMYVWGDDGKSRLDFSAYEAGVEALAWIVESRNLEQALWQALRERSRVSLYAPAAVTALDRAGEAVSLALGEGTRLTASLLVGADGARSWVRAQAGLPFRDKDYHQLGVVANFACERSHGGIARQWFRADGILAWLPLPGNRISMVWSTDTEHAAKLLAASPEELGARVAEAGGGALGELAVLTPAQAFPLHLIQVETVVAPRLALVGDAAHQVHPLAGQGVNLGFADAEGLANTLAGRGPRDPGDLLLLRRYERARREDVLAMQLVTDGLKELFAQPGPWLRLLRNAGLSLTGRVGLLKQMLVRHALGTV